MAVNVSVEVRNNNVDSALKIFRKKLKDAEVMKYYEKHLAYEKPSVKKRRRLQQSKRVNEYNMKMMND